MLRNLRLYPWFQFAQNLLFWQAIWFLYFERSLTAAEAIVLAAVYDIAVVITEVPSGYFSDVFGRRVTLAIASGLSILSCVLLAVGETFAVFALAQALLGIGRAFTSGTDSALLYDSLAANGRENDIAAEEIRSWRYAFAALALSAVLGGAIAIWSFPGTFWLTALAAGGALAVVLQFSEPPVGAGQAKAELPLAQVRLVLSRLRDPVLAWMFVFAAGSYALSHVPWAFGQPWLRQMLAGSDLAPDLPFVSGLVTATMMLVSVLAGWYALAIRHRLGTLGVFVLSMALQTILIGALAAAYHPAIVALLFLRLVPGALSNPFKMEMIQPRIESRFRATYLSVQNLCGRLLFSISLLASAWLVTGESELNEAGMAIVLPYYAMAAAALLIALALTARRALSGTAAVEPRH